MILGILESIDNLKKKRFTNNKVLIMLLLGSVCMAGKAKAQSRSGNNKVMNLQNYDNRKIHFGFLIAANIADFRIKYNKTYFGSDTIINVQSKRESGFNLGIITDLKLAQYLSIRFIPTLSFSTRTLQYDLIEKKTLIALEKPVESIFLDLPLLFKYKSERVGNFRAYLIGGLRYSFDMASQKDVNSNLVKDIIVKIDKNDFMIEFGVGFDLYLTYFKLSPEIKFSFGLKNILIQESNVLTKPIQSLTTRIVQVSFNLE